MPLYNSSFSTMTFCCIHSPIHSTKTVRHKETRSIHEETNYYQHYFKPVVLIIDILFCQCDKFN